MELQRVALDLFRDNPVVYARVHASSTRVFVDEKKLLLVGGYRQEGQLGSPQDGQQVNLPENPQDGQQVNLPEARQLTLRISRLKPGDRFCPLGMNGRHRLVSDVLIDRKVPRRKRLDICKVCVGKTGEAVPRDDSQGVVRGARDVAQGARDEIVWIIGVQPDDRFKVSEETASMLSIIVDGQVNYNERVLNHA